MSTPSLADIHHLSTGCSQLDISLEDRQIRAFMAYRDLLLKWAHKVNLISTSDRDRIVTHHFLDSLTALPFLRDLCDLRILDIGSGAGFPGVPLKIVRPDLRLTLVESRRKVASFLRTLVRTLDLTDVNVLCSRAEDLSSDPQYRFGFDGVTARAVAQLPVLFTLCEPLLKPSGFLMCYRGPHPTNEIEALCARFPDLRFNIQIQRIQVPIIERQGSLVFIKKT